MKTVIDYEAFCAKPTPQNTLMLKRLYALYLIHNEYELAEYDGSELEELIPGHHVYNALSEMAIEHLVTISDEDGEPLDKEDFEWHDLIDTQIELTSDGKAVAEKSDEIVEEYLDKLRKDKAVASAKKVLSTVESEKEQTEIQKEVDKLGGLIFPGLYHGSRRVRAHLKEITEWILSDDEKDLIAAVGNRRIRHGMNKIDLRNRYGLREESEIAPVRFEIDKYGRLRVERDDEWGEKGRPYRDMRSFMRRLTGDWNAASIAYLLLLPHLAILMWLLENISSRASKIIFAITFLMTLPIINMLSGVFSNSSLMEQIGLSIATIYLFGPVVLFMMGVMTRSE